MKQYVGVGVVIIDALAGKARLEAPGIEYGFVGCVGIVSKAGYGGNLRVLAGSDTGAIAVRNLVAVVVAKQDSVDPSRCLAASFLDLDLDVVVAGTRQPADVADIPGQSIAVFDWLEVADG